MPPFISYSVPEADEAERVIKRLEWAKQNDSKVGRVPLLSEQFAGGRIVTMYLPEETQEHSGFTVNAADQMIEYFKGAKGEREAQLFTRKWPLSVATAKDMELIESYYHKGYEDTRWRVGTEPLMFNTGGEALAYYYTHVQPRHALADQAFDRTQTGQALAMFAENKVWPSFKVSADETRYLNPLTDTVEVTSTSQFRRKVFELEEQFGKDQHWVDTQAQFDDAVQAYRAKAVPSKEAPVVYNAGKPEAGLDEVIRVNVVSVPCQWLEQTGWMNDSLAFRIAELAKTVTVQPDTFTAPFMAAKDTRQPGESSSMAIYKDATQLQLQPAEHQIRVALDAGATADQVAASVWGESATWASVQASYSRDYADTLAVWQEAGYSLVEIDSFCCAASKVVDGVMFWATDSDGRNVPNPDFACTYGAYNPETEEFLDFIETTYSLADAEPLLADWAATLQDRLTPANASTSKPTSTMRM